MTPQEHPNETLARPTEPPDRQRRAGPQSGDAATTRQYCRDPRTLRGE